MTALRTPHRAALGAATALLLLFAGTACGNEQTEARTTKNASPDDNGKNSPSGPSSKPTGTETGGSAVPVYYLGDTKAGVRLFREFHRASGDRLTAALGLAVHDTADDPDYRSGWPDGTRVRSASASNGSITVDLSGSDLSRRPSDTSGAEARQALNAVVYTADGVTQTKSSVAFRIDGRPADTVLGVDVGSAVQRANPDKVKATVSVFSPAQGATVTSPVKVTGEAATFEANVVWELRQDGKVVKRGFTTAKECCTLAPYSFTLKADPGKYTLVVRDTNERTGKGAGTGQDTKDITVR